MRLFRIWWCQAQSAAQPSWLHPCTLYVQRVVQLASDDFPHTPQEGRLEEQVRAALASLQALGRVQPALQQHWAPDYRGRVNGVEMDHAALCRHWAALQVGPGGTGWCRGCAPSVRGASLGPGAAACIEPALSTLSGARLQERLTTVLVDVKEVVVHSTALGEAG